MRDINGNYVTGNRRMAAKDKEIERLHSIIRTLRNRWFTYHMKELPDLRMEENEWSRIYRDRRNEELQAQYDEQTEALLRGDDVPLTPTCGADMDRRNG